MSQETDSKDVPSATVAQEEATITCIVENEPGVLARVVGLFARRGFNITALSVAPTEEAKFSRITFVYDMNSVPVEQLMNQVNKLINVIDIQALDTDETTKHDLLIATINSDSSAFPALVTK